MPESVKPHTMADDERQVISTRLTIDTVRRLDEFCERTKRNRSLALELAVELLLDNEDPNKRKAR
jgi:predicted transcriptional regulator